MIKKNKKKYLDIILLALSLGITFGIYIAVFQTMIESNIETLFEKIIGCGIALLIANWFGSLSINTIVFKIKNEEG